MHDIMCCAIYLQKLRMLNGPRIVDPRSGEIIETHICWYHNVMKLLKEWYMIQCGPNDKGAQTMKFDDD